MGNFNIANSAAYEHMAWAGSTSAGPPDHRLAVYGQTNTIKFLS